MIPPFCKVDLAGGFREYWRGSARGSFFTPWDQSGDIPVICTTVTKEKQKSGGL